MNASEREGVDDGTAVFSLDDDRALDIEVAGAKAAWLARGRRSGLPILPGYVMSSEVSKPYVMLGTETLGTSGSGAARMAIINADPPADVATLENLTDEWDEPLIVRSSSMLEASGVWSGAFTSYLDLLHGELGVGVLGCWASMFSPATLERFEAAGEAPGASPMAVLVQPAIEPRCGGTARLVGDTVDIAAVEGSPGPLVQGWSPGVAAKVGPSGDIEGRAAIELLGSELLRDIADLMRAANDATGANGCEWGATSEGLTLFQITRSVPERAPVVVELPPGIPSHHATRVASLVRRFPGPLGEALVLPWMLGSSADAIPPATLPTDLRGDVLAAANGASARLTAQVWAQRPDEAHALASRTLRELRSAQPSEALDRIAVLPQPDPDGAGELLGLIGALAAAMVERGLITDPGMIWQVDPADAARALEGGLVMRRDRFGFDRWEPFTAGVVSATGRTVLGQPAGPGIGAGRMCRVLDTEDMRRFRPRDVLVSTHPVPNLAPLLWDASAVVTIGGSAGAHLFESARAVGIPAVCGVRIEDVIGGDLADVEDEFVLAVDGFEGVVAAAAW